MPKRRTKGGSSDIATMQKQLADITKSQKEVNIKEQAAQDKQNVISSQLDKNSSSTFNTKIKNFRLIWATILEIPKKLGALFTRKYPFSHYLALILFIMLLIGGISFFVIRSKKGVPKKKKSWVPSAITRFFQRFMPGYRMSLLAGQLSPGTPITEPRGTIVGRCDNTIYKESILPGRKGGMCVNSVLPEPITWVIDSEKIDELKDIPQTIKNTISNNGAKFIVKIPWRENGMVYVPDCANATFSDGTPAYLLIDNGLICNKVELEKIKYDPAYRLKLQRTDNKGLGVFE